MASFNGNVYRVYGVDISVYVVAGNASDAVKLSEEIYSNGTSLWAENVEKLKGAIVSDVIFSDSAVKTPSVNKIVRMEEAIKQTLPFLEKVIYSYGMGGNDDRTPSVLYDELKKSLEEL